jgi:hypothetical protein
MSARLAYVWCTKRKMLRLLRIFIWTSGSKARDPRIKWSEQSQGHSCSLTKFANNLQNWRRAWPTRDCRPILFYGARIWSKQDFSLYCFSVHETVRLLNPWGTLVSLLNVGRVQTNCIYYYAPISYSFRWGSVPTNMLLDFWKKKLIYNSSMSGKGVPSDLRDIWFESRPGHRLS